LAERSLVHRRYAVALDAILRAAAVLGVVASMALWLFA
jgi:hypothetical protein